MKKLAGFLAVALVVLSAYPQSDKRAQAVTARPASSIITLLDGVTINAGQYVDTPVVTLGTATNMTLFAKVHGDPTTPVNVICSFGLSDWSNYAADVVKTAPLYGYMYPPPAGTGGVNNMPLTIPVAGETFACRLQDMHDPQNPAPGDVTVTIKLLLR